MVDTNLTYRHAVMLLVIMTLILMQTTITFAQTSDDGTQTEKDKGYSAIILDTTTTPAFTTTTTEDPNRFTDNPSSSPKADYNNGPDSPQVNGVFSVYNFIECIEK